MASNEHSGSGRKSAVSMPERRLISRLAPVLNRPLAIGVVALLFSFFCCGALAQTAPVSEGKTYLATVPSQAGEPLHSRASDNVPLLFLAALGLGGVALSQTRPTERPGQRAGSLCAGKNVARGQELPAIIPPQPPLGVVAGKHHDDVVGLEPVGAFRMLDQ